MPVLDDFVNHDRRALARLITHIENRRDDFRRLLSSISRLERHAYRIGVTGPPGSGKSTLVDAMVMQYAEKGLKIGVIAIDPSSPFTGGALLGDRIRMQHLSNRDNVFIRSMASRGQSGGLAAATRDVITILDAFGMDMILIETVGIGQVELDIVEACDSVVVVLVPESGDMIQTMKAGLMEIADIFCVNKADRPGSERLISMLNLAIHQKLTLDSLEIPAVGTNAVTREGVDKLLEAIEKHRQFLEHSGTLELRRKRQLKAEVLQTVRDRVISSLEEMIDFDGEFEGIGRKLISGETDPYSAADLIYDQYIRGRLVNG